MSIVSYLGRYLSVLLQYYTLSFVSFAPNWNVFVVPYIYVLLQWFHGHVVMDLSNKTIVSFKLGKLFYQVDKLVKIIYVWFEHLYTPAFVLTQTKTYAHKRTHARTQTRTQTHTMCELCTRWLTLISFCQWVMSELCVSHLLDNGVIIKGILKMSICMSVRIGSVCVLWRRLIIQKLSPKLC